MTLLLAVLWVFCALAVQTLPSPHWAVRPGVLALACLLTFVLSKAGMLT